MRTGSEIEKLLPDLEHCVADDFEAQDLDFKQWDVSSRDKAVKKVVEMAVCMANGGGGTVVFGVADHVKGRNKAISGVPPEINTDLLKKAVYEQTDPKITPVFEELPVKEGTGRIVLMQIYPGFPPYTDTAGRGSIRVGKDCKPLTGTLRRKIAVETGETDYTAETVCAADGRLLSASAMETLRTLARKERAPEDLLYLSDKEMLSALGLVKGKQFTRAAILLAGAENAVREYLPGHNWTFLQMTSDTEYGVREDGVSALPISVRRLEELLVPFNPITTFRQGMFHFEYRTWPEIAMREALMNALCHADFRIAGPVMVKVYGDRLEISNNGGFIAGITPENILHHPPAARNLLMVEALTRLRLVNRNNLGISRMFSALLVEGKEAPIIHETGNSVTLSFYRRDLNPAFRMFVAEESDHGRFLNVDQLILLQYLLRHTEAATATAAVLCHRKEPQIRETLSAMEQAGYIVHAVVGGEAYWSMDAKLLRRLSGRRRAGKHQQNDRDKTKAKILAMLKDRAHGGEPGLSNEEIRQISGYDRNQAYQMMRELRVEDSRVISPGRGRKAIYTYRDKC